MYTYEELLRLSGFKARAGEKEMLEARLMMVENLSPFTGEIERKDTALRDDKALPSRENAEITKNAKNTKEGFIEIPEAYYEGEN